MEKELIVITGCDSGIGKACAELLIKNGRDVAVSFLEADPFKGEPLCHSYKMDLRKESDIIKFAKSIKKLCGGGYSLSCLFNNAGVALGGPVENAPLALFREVLEVNYFGYVSLIGKLIPVLKESRGMIMINGSLAGRIALPFMAPYSSSKFAIEGFTDSLRRELKPFGIRTVLIEPAAVATPIWTKAKEADNSFIDEVYHESISAFMENFVDAGSRGMPVEQAAEQIVRIIDKKNPKARYIISGNRFGSYIQYRIPDRFMDSFVRKAFRMYYG